MCVDKKQYFPSTIEFEIPEYQNDFFFKVDVDFWHEPEDKSVGFAEQVSIVSVKKDGVKMELTEELRKICEDEIHAQIDKIRYERGYRR
jgi:hypothetical protein